MPSSLKFDDKKAKSKIDFPLALRQHQDLTETLTEAGIEVIELANAETEPTIPSLFADDLAIVINGTALLTRPKSNNNKKTPVVSRTNEFVSVLNSLAWQVVEAPLQIHGRSVVLEGSDVVFTEKEIFVGIRKNGTNTEGALIVAKTFADYSVIPISIAGTLPLKAHISVATNEILSVGKDKDSQSILKCIERDATFRYNVLTVDSEEAVPCLNVNNHLIFRLDLNEPKFRMLQPPVELWGVNVSELNKIGGPFQRYCLLVNKLSAKRRE
ncbi:hypothetical protein niasHS_002683 [Heterodera schachtii]|uniref:Dimethylargininase n=1 Tax=Heterodera schachtii TaxID=97005 RepID=A0ABD2K258_HETSC